MALHIAVHMRKCFSRQILWQKSEQNHKFSLFTEHFTEQFVKQHRKVCGILIFHNIFVGKWEADLLEVTRSRLTYEYEVKVSRCDFHKDKKKSDKYGKNKFDVVTSGQRTNYFYYIVPKSLIKPDEVPDFAGLIYAYEGSVQCYSLEKGRYAVKRIFFEVVKPAQKVSDMKADDNFIRKLDLSMYYRYHQMRRDNYKNKE